MHNKVDRLDWTKERSYVYGDAVQYLSSCPAVQRLGTIFDFLTAAKNFHLFVLFFFTMILLSVIAGIFLLTHTGSAVLTTTVTLTPLFFASYFLGTKTILNNEYRRLEAAGETRPYPAGKRAILLRPLVAISTTLPSHSSSIFRPPR